MVLWSLLPDSSLTSGIHADIAPHGVHTNFSAVDKVIQGAETALAKLGWVGFVPGELANFSTPSASRGFRLEVKHNTEGPDTFDGKGSLKNMADGISAGVLDSSGLDWRVPPMPIVNATSAAYKNLGDDVFVTKEKWLRKWLGDSSDPYAKLKRVHTGSRGILHPHHLSGEAYIPARIRRARDVGGDDSSMFHTTKEPREGSLGTSSDRTGLIMDDEYLDFPRPHRVRAAVMPSTEGEGKEHGESGENGNRGTNGGNQGMPKMFNILSTAKDVDFLPQATVKR